MDLTDNIISHYTAYYLCWSANAQCWGRQTFSHHYLLTADECEALHPVVVILRPGGEGRCPTMGSYHLVFGRTLSFPLSWPPQALHHPDFLPCCPCGYHLPQVWCSGPHPSMPTPRSTLALLLLPPCSSFPTTSPSPSSLSNFYSQCPSLYSSMSKSNSLLFPLAAQAHTADLVLQVSRGNLQPALLFGDQPQRDFCGSELEHAWLRWDF